MQGVEGKIASRGNRDLPEFANVPYLTIPAINNLQRIVHAFTTRNNNLGARKRGIKSSSDWDVVADLFNITPDRVVTANQVHGDVVVIADDHSYQLMHATEADAMITSTPGIAIGVETADCVPILLIDPMVPAVAAVHAGWRGTVKNIVRKAVMLMHERLGSDPTQLIAAFGPAIGPECYEVDEPVMRPVREAFPFWKDVASSRGNEKWSLDLVKANWLELLQTGLKEKNIHLLGICTSCRRDLFYSFRAESRTGRMLSIVMIKP
jgi:purine-nucleoside/S-methyl-5'-thioadenosine phosphorylase / adenosine deaminase